MNKILLLAFLCYAQSCLGFEFDVLTYNLGQLKKAGVDLVPCTKPRLRPQLRALFNEVLPQKMTTEFALTLQEVWTKRAFSALKTSARERGLTVIPQDFAKVTNSGTVILTNAQVLEMGFKLFTRNDYLRKGILFARVRLQGGAEVTIADVHTGFSGAKHFAHEHRAHLQDIERFAHERLKLGNSHFVLAGDFNVGPDLTYVRQRFSPIEEIWQQTLMPAFTGAGLYHASANSGVTWDTRNALVKRPAFAVRVRNRWLNGRPGWETKTSTLDHVFADHGLAALSSEVVLNQKYRIECPKRDGGRNLTHLSDHFAVKVRLAGN